jgi:hypothetical protein
LFKKELKGKRVVRGLLIIPFLKGERMPKAAKGIFEKLNKKYKAESEDSLLYTIFGQQLAQPYSPPRSLLISTYELTLWERALCGE